MENIQSKICLELVYEGHEIPNVQVSAQTEVLGGKIARVDWEGGTFNELDWFRSLFICDEQMQIISSRANDEEFMDEVREKIRKALKKLMK